MSRLTRHAAGGNYGGAYVSLIFIIIPISGPIIRSLTGPDLDALLASTWTGFHFGGASVQHTPMINI